MAHYNNIHEMYADIERHEEMLKRGRELYKELQQLKHRSDFLECDEQGFMSTLKSQYDWDCIQLAMDKFGNIPPTSSAPPEGSNDGKASPTGLQKKGWERLKTTTEPLRETTLFFKDSVLTMGSTSLLGLEGMVNLSLTEESLERNGKNQPEVKGSV